LCKKHLDRFNRGHWKYFGETNRRVKEFTDKADFGANYTGPSKKQKDHYSTDFVVDRGIEFIKSAARQRTPFALMVSITDPHSPNENRPPWSTRYQTAKFKYPRTAAANMKADPAPPSWNSFNREEYPFEKVDQYIQGFESGFFWQNQMQQYFGMVPNVDFNMGKLLYTIRDAGIEDDTIFIFTSDWENTVEVTKERHTKPVPVFLFLFDTLTKLKQARLSKLLTHLWILLLQY